LTYNKNRLKISFVLVTICSAASCKWSVAMNNFLTSRWRSYVIESLHPGMTRNEVEETLGQIAPVSILDTSITANDQTHISMRLRLCNNPLGDLVLDVYYFKDGNLIRAEDAWAD